MLGRFERVAPRKPPKTKRPTTRVEATRKSIRDRGSTPLTSTSLRQGYGCPALLRKGFLLVTYRIGRGPGRQAPLPKPVRFPPIAPVERGPRPRPLQNLTQVPTDRRLPSHRLRGGRRRPPGRPGLGTHGRLAMQDPILNCVILPCSIL